MASIANVPTLASKVIPIGICYGEHKLQDCKLFLRQFVSECISLVTNGIIVNGKKIGIAIKGFICDAPVKTFILGVKGHTGYSSCTKCKQEGSFFSNRVTFPNLTSVPRTHEGFLRKEDEDFHVADTPLISVPGVDFIKSFPLDYMHLVCLGVMRNLLNIWTFGPVPLKFHHRIVGAIASNLLSIQSSVPLEFCRKTRGLDQLKRWKATEFRQFLLCTGPVVLKDVLLHDY